MIFRFGFCIFILIWEDRAHTPFSDAYSPIKDFIVSVTERPLYGAHSLPAPADKLLEVDVNRSVYRRAIVEYVAGHTSRPRCPVGVFIKCEERFRWNRLNCEYMFPFGF